MVDLHDVQRVMEQKRAERDRVAGYQREARAQVAVKMEYVTRSAEWNTYLEHLQAMVEADEQRAKSLERELLSPEQADPVTTARLKMKLMQLQGRIDARKADMALPGQLIEAGKTA